MTVTRSQVEDFLYFEAELLDQWRLNEWAALFTEDGRYLVPPIGYPDADSQNTLFLIADDRFRLEQRARRLLKRQAHAEYPHSSTRHMIHNVRIQSVEGDLVLVGCNFVAYRTKNDVMDTYVGHIQYRLIVSPNGEFKIREKRVILDLDTLRPQGKVSIIL